MWKRAIACALAMLCATGVARAQEPRELSAPSALKADMGAVRISVRSQVQLSETLHLWFLPEGATAADWKQGLRFERKQGVPLAGTNMIDSRPRFFAVRPGRYRLAAHVVGCEQLPPPGAVCTVNYGLMPTGTYETDAVTFEVRAGELTDLGEFILELPPSADPGAISFKRAFKQMQDAAIRWRPIATPLADTFTAMQAAPAPQVPASLQSNLKCEVKPKGTKGMMLFYPFAC
jgi:hypothetical protein